MRDNLGKRDIKAIANAIAKTAPNPVAGTSSLSRLRSELEKLKASKMIIDVTFNPEMTRLSTKSKRSVMINVKMRDSIFQTTSH